MKLLYRVNGWGSISAGQTNPEDEGSTFLQIIRIQLPHIAEEQNHHTQLRQTNDIGKHCL